MTMIYQVEQARRLIREGWKIEVIDGLYWLVRGRQSRRLYANVVKLLVG
jgi:hypothetical protein